MKQGKFNLNQKGAAAVEAAIIFMLLLAFIFGIIEFGLLFFNKQMMTNASREGARAGIVLGIGRSGGTTAPYLIVSANTARQFCEQHLITFGSGALSILASYTDRDGNGTPTRGDDLIVRLAYDFDFLFISALGIGPVTLNAVSTMKLE